MTIRAGSLVLAVIAVMIFSGQAEAASENTPNDRLKEFREISRLIEGQQQVLAQSNRDLAKAKRDLAGPSPESVLGETAKELQRVATEQAKMAAKAATTKTGFKAEVQRAKVGVATTKNGVKVLSYSDAYWARVAAIQKATAAKAQAERRMQTARSNLQAAYLALLVSLPGLPTSALPEVRAKLSALDAQSRKLGLGAIMSSAKRSRGPGRSSPDHDIGIRSDIGPRDTGPKDTGPKDTGPKDTGPKDTGPKDTGPKDSGSKGGPTMAGPG